MSKSSTNSNALVGAKNLLRGAKDPWSALSTARSLVSGNDLQAFVRWMPSLPWRVGSISSMRFPRRLEHLGAHVPLQPVTLTQEVAWASAQILVDTPHIVRFLQLKAEYEQVLCNGSAPDCIRILDKLETELGFSFWSLEARINALQIFKGLEAQKSFLAGLRQMLPGKDLLSFIAHHISRRSEPTTPAMSYSENFSKMTTAWNDESGLAKYLNYRIAGIPPTIAADYVNLLRHETRAAAVDQYETLVYLAGTTATTGQEEVAAVFDLPVQRLLAKIGDERLAKILILRGRTVGIDYLNFVNDRATDLTLTGDFSQASNTIDSCIANQSNDTILWRLRATIAENTSDTISTKQSLAYNASDKIQSFIGENSEGDDAHNQLLWLALALRSLSFSASLIFICWSLKGAPEIIVRKLEKIAFIQRRDTRADDIALLPNTLRTSFLQAARLAIGDVPAITRASTIIGLPSQGRAELSPDELYRAKVEVLQLRGDYRAALDILLPQIDAPSIEQSRWAIRQASTCMVHIKEFTNLARFIVKHATLRPGLIRSLPIADCVQGLDTAARGDLKPEITLPIVLHLAVQRGDDSCEDARAYAYEDFLIANTVKRPSELGNIADGFEPSLLVYYLRHLCVPVIMQVSSEFQSTRELHEERIAVLRLLLKLDPESEPPRILRRLLFPREWSHDEQS